METLKSDLASRIPVLKKRLRRLLGEGGGKKAAEISDVILPQLSKVGHLALIGGAVRDVARCGVRRCKSDLDFVLYEGNAPAFRTLMQDLSARPNRFVGYSIRYPQWRVDIWALEEPWAHTAGLRQVDRLEDLLDCTFFDWDAIVFDLRTSRIIMKPDYFQALASNIMDINLESNPNPTGALVRALRRGYLWRTRFGKKLTTFVKRQLTATPWETLVALDDSAFASPVLRFLDPKQIQVRMAQDIPSYNMMVTEPFGDPPCQGCLPL